MTQLTKKEQILEVFDNDLTQAYRAESRSGDFDGEYNEWTAQYDADSLMDILGVGDAGLEEQVERYHEDLYNLEIDEERDVV